MSSSPNPAVVPPLVLPDRRRRKRRRRLMASVVALGIVGAVAFLAFPRKRSDDGVRTEPVGRRTIVRVVTLTGHLDVMERVDVPAALGGSLVSIDVQPGDAVVAGQPLARLDPRRSDLALRSAQATLDASTSRVASARAAVDGARDALARVERLSARELASDADVEAARRAVQQADAALRAARAEQALAANGLGTAELGAESGLLRAPIDGIVLQAPRRLGSLVGPELGAIFVVGRGLDPLRLEANVGEADIGDVRVGQPSWFEVASHPGRRFEARLTRVELDANVLPGSVTFPVQFQVPNPEGALRPGLTAMVHVEVDRASDALSVHEAALRFEPAGAAPAPARSRVWLKVGPGRLEPVAVVAGVSDGALTEIRPVRPGSLAVGSRVVVGARVEAGGTRVGLSLGSGTRRAAP